MWCLCDFCEAGEVCIDYYHCNYYHYTVVGAGRRSTGIICILQFFCILCTVLRVGFLFSNFIDIFLFIALAKMKFRTPHMWSHGFPEVEALCTGDPLRVWLSHRTHPEAEGPDKWFLQPVQWNGSFQGILNPGNDNMEGLIHCFITLTLELSYKVPFMSEGTQCNCNRDANSDLAFTAFLVIECL